MTVCRDYHHSHSSEVPSKDFGEAAQTRALVTSP